MPLIKRLVRRTRIVAPWTLILVLAGAFQIYRGAVTDAIIFLLPAALLIADSLGLLAFAGRLAPFAYRRWLVVALLAVFCAVLVLSPRGGLADVLAMLGIAVAALPLAWPDRLVREGTHGAEARDADLHDADALGADVRGADARDAPAAAAALRRSAVLWAAIAVATCVWEVVSFVLGAPSDAAAQEHPTVSILLDPVVGDPFGRLAFVVVWILGGVALLHPLGRR